MWRGRSNGMRVCTGGLVARKVRWRRRVRGIGREWRVYVLVLSMRRAWRIRILRLVLRVERRGRHVMVLRSGVLRRRDDGRVLGRPLAIVLFSVA